jgi:hypothetical protein
MYELGYQRLQIPRTPNPKHLDHPREDIQSSLHALQLHRRVDPYVPDDAVSEQRAEFVEADLGAGWG